MQPARRAARRPSRDFVELSGPRAGIVGLLREGAVGAAVAAEIGERDEDVARDADARRPCRGACSRPRPRARGVHARVGRAGPPSRSARPRSSPPSSSAAHERLGLAARERGCRGGEASRVLSGGRHPTLAHDRESERRRASVPRRPAPALADRSEAVEVHHLGPAVDEVAHELLLAVGRGVDLRDGAQLGVRAEDQVDRRGRPLDLAGRAVATFVEALGRRRTCSTWWTCRAGSRRSRC